MKEVEILSVIRTHLLQRGDGKEDPIRLITQYWCEHGTLLAEIDSLAQERK